MSNNKKLKKSSTKTLRGVLAPKVTHFSANRVVTDGDVAVRAYLIWQHEGRPEGRHVEHWLAAEAELRA